MKPRFLIEKEFYFNQYQTEYEGKEPTCKVIEATYDEEGKEVSPRGLSDGIPSFEQYLEFMTPNAEGDTFMQSQDLLVSLQDAQIYLLQTDHKFYGDYEPKVGEDLDVIKVKRKEARDLLRGHT